MNYLIAPKSSMVNRSDLDGWTNVSFQGHCMYVSKTLPYSYSICKTKNWFLWLWKCMWNQIICL